jgi:type IV pilus biogenesis protein CpaD/CtpE
MKQLIGLALAIALAGCASAPKSVPLVAKVPVPQPCVEGERPKKVVPLKQDPSDAEWAEMDLKQRTARAGQWALDLLNYAEDLDAATAGCR